MPTMALHSRRVATSNSICTSTASPVLVAVTVKPLVPLRVITVLEVISFVVVISPPQLLLANHPSGVAPQEQNSHIRPNRFYRNPCRHAQGVPGTRSASLA